MSFQFDEKMMAENRAIITRNKCKEDLIGGADKIKFKPGMMHYVSKDSSIWLSTDPVAVKDTKGNSKVQTFLELLTDLHLYNALGEYVNKDGGEYNALKGVLHSTVTDKAPFNVKSDKLVSNLNADAVDGKHVNDDLSTEDVLWTAKKILNTMAPSGFGIGSSPVAFNDCDNVIGTGFFYGFSPLHMPNNEKGSVFLQSQHDTENALQTMYVLDTENVYRRKKIQGAWQPWKKNTSTLDMTISKEQPKEPDSPDAIWLELID